MRKSRNSGRHAVILLSSLVLLAATLWLPRTASSPEEARSARMGAPIPYVVQDLTTYDEPLPHRYTFQSPWENPTRVLWGQLLLSLLVLFFVLEALVFLFRGRGIR